MCFFPWDLQIHIQVSELHLGFFPLPCSSEGKKKSDRHRGWIYLLVYLLVIKGKAISSQEVGISAAHEHVFPFFHSSANKCDRKRQFWFATAEVAAVHFSSPELHSSSDF